MRDSTTKIAFQRNHCDSLYDTDFDVFCESVDRSVFLLFEKHLLHCTISYKHFKLIQRNFDKAV